MPVSEEMKPRFLLDVVKERKDKLTPPSLAVTDRGRDEELAGRQQTAALGAAKGNSLGTVCRNK